MPKFDKILSHKHRQTAGHVITFPYQRHRASSDLPDDHTEYRGDHK